MKIETTSKNIAVVLGVGQNFWRDQRVKRTVKALIGQEYNVYAYTSDESKREEEQIENLTIRYIKVPFNHKSFRIPLNHIFFNIFLAIDMKKNNIDICHCNEIDMSLCGMLLKIFTLGKSHVIYDAHEDYVAAALQTYGRLFSKLTCLVETLFVKLFVDACITVSERIKNKFNARGLDCNIIMNCQELKDYFANKKNKEFCVVYQGAINYGRGHDKLVEAISLLDNEEEQNVKIKVVIIGDSIDRKKQYRKKIEDMIRGKKLERYFTFTGFLKHEKMMELVSQADVGLILDQPTPNDIDSLPNKFFENLVAGIPTIASNYPQVGRILNEENCGLLVDSTNPKDIAEAIKYLYKHEDERKLMGKNALNAAKSKYNFEVEAKKLIKIYSNIS